MSEDGKGLNGVIAEIERRIVRQREAEAVGSSAPMPIGLMDNAAVRAYRQALEDVLPLLTALRDAVRERREAFTAQQQQPGYGPGDDENYAWQYAIDQLSWVLGADQ